MTVSAPVQVSEVPAPFVRPELWQTVILTLPDGTQCTLPPNPREGTAIVDLDTKVDIDQKQSGGQGASPGGAPKKPRKAETTVKKIDPTKGTIELQWSSRIYAAMEAELAKIHPNGANGGLPLDAMNPEFDANFVKRIIIDSFGKKKREGSLTKLTLQISEWNPPPPAAPGDGAETPTETPKWSASFGSGSTDKIGSNNNKVGGFGGPNAPVTKP